MKSEIRFLINRVLCIVVLVVMAGTPVFAQPAPPVPQELAKGVVAATPVIGASPKVARSPNGKLVFDGDSTKLKATKVVATLDAPIQKGMNVIWCASFLSAWKTLEMDLAKEPLTLQGSPAVAVSLSNEADPRPFIPEESLYVAAGWADKGIIGQITKDLLLKFPTKESPTFPRIAHDSFVAYAYLEAKMKFSLEYSQNPEPMIFTDSAGKKTELTSFGISYKDKYGLSKLRRQPEILCVAKDDRGNLTECVVDLDRNSQPNQIILASMEPKTDLLQMEAAVEDKISQAKMDKERNLSLVDSLLVPAIVWRITHQFAELIGHTFTNTVLEGETIGVAQQDIQFRLDRSGVELRSEAKIYRPIGDHVGMNFLFNRPFLLCMKKRGAAMPYFVMWVDNAELLNKW